MLLICGVHQHAYTSMAGLLQFCVEGAMMGSEIIVLDWGICQ